MLVPSTQLWWQRVVLKASLRPCRLLSADPRDHKAVSGLQISRLSGFDTQHHDLPFFWETETWDAHPFLAKPRLPMDCGLTQLAVTNDLSAHAGPLTFLQEALDKGAGSRFSMAPGEPACPD